MLDLDQKMFRKTIDKIVKAHKKEIDWVRSMYMHDTKAHLEERFQQTQQVLREECHALLHQFEALKQELSASQAN